MAALRFFAGDIHDFPYFIIRSLILSGTRFFPNISSGIALLRPTQ
jgi:hypothetical protein